MRQHNAAEACLAMGNYLKKAGDGLKAFTCSDMVWVESFVHLKSYHKDFLAH